MPPKKSTRRKATRAKTVAKVIPPEPSDHDSSSEDVDADEESMYLHIVHFHRK